MSNWNPLRRNQLLLAYPHHDLNLLPVPVGTSRRRQAGQIFRSVVEKRRDLQVVAEFRNKLRQTEDLISKLAFSLREIQGARKKPKADKPKSAKLSAIQRIGRSRDN